MDSKIHRAHLFSSQRFYELPHFINAQDDYEILQITLYFSRHLEIELPIDLAHHWGIVENQY